jgi:hypothetical protein
MVPEPTHSAVQVAIAGFSATILSITGVTFHGLLWGMLGALVALLITPPQDRGKAVVAVFCGALCGAVLSDLGLSLAVGLTGLSEKTAESMHLGAAFLIGGGAKQIFAAGINLLVSKMMPKAAGQ